LKIEGQKNDQVETTDDSKRNEASSKNDDKKSFKDVLERKEGDKDGETSKKSKKSRKQASNKQATNTQNKRPNGARTKPGQAGTFGEQLKDGKPQLGQQTEQSERLGGERTTTRHHSETRVEHRHRKTHQRHVHQDHSRQTNQEPGDRTKPSKARPTPVGDIPGSASRAIAGAEPTGTSKAEAAAPSDRTEQRAQVAELARKLVDRAHVGQDASGRQIMLLDLEVPGRGNVRVRLRRRGEGFELRMRPENDEFARDLRHEREHFRQSAAEGGVDFSSIEIV
jgi:hypothetical protein